MLKESLAITLCKILEDRGLTEDAFAKLLKLPRATMRAALQGRADLPISTVEKIAKQLDFNPVDLISDFHSEEMQAEALAYLLESYVDQPLAYRMRMAKMIQEILSFMHPNQGSADSPARANRQADETATKST